MQRPHLNPAVDKLCLDIFAVLWCHEHSHTDEKLNHHFHYTNLTPTSKKLSKWWPPPTSYYQDTSTWNGTWIVLGTVPVKFFVRQRYKFPWLLRQNNEQCTFNARPAGTHEVDGIRKCSTYKEVLKDKGRKLKYASTPYHNSAIKETILIWNNLKRWGGPRESRVDSKTIQEILTNLIIAVNSEFCNHMATIKERLGSSTLGLACLHARSSIRAGEFFFMAPGA